MTTNVCANITANISFDTSLNVSIYITSNATLNIPFNITPHICIDLEDSQLSINKSKSDQLINFFDLRHCL